MSMQKRVAAFEKMMGWEKTPAGRIALFLKSDAIALNEQNGKHKVVDLHLEVMQLANRLKVDLDEELGKRFKETEKKTRKRR